jgi:CRISPR system Cascade subunit CasE
MYLTRLFLNPASRGVRFDAANPEGLHKTVMRLFPMSAGPQPRQAHGVLHRLDESSDGRLMLLVQSLVRPDAAALPAGYLADSKHEPDLVPAGAENPSIRAVGEERARIAAGSRWAFRLKANATRKVDTKTGPDGMKKNGRRVPLHGDESLLEWLKRHGEAAGFAVVAARVTKAPAKGRGVRLAGAVFDGILEVSNADAFRDALAAGVGPAKAFGFGLLSIARP